MTEEEELLADDAGKRVRAFHFSRYRDEENVQPTGDAPLREPQHWPGRGPKATIARFPEGHPNSAAPRPSRKCLDCAKSTGLSGSALRCLECRKKFKKAQKMKKREAV